jgi:hypothetical protein
VGTILKVGIDAWIIQDGNYEDLEVGQPISFALEFYAKEYFDSAGEDKGLQQRSDEFISNGVGEVVFIGPKVWIADFGVMAYAEGSPPPGLRIGSKFGAKIYIGIDHYPYFEDFYRLEGIPPLIYSWNIRDLKLDVTPLIQGSDRALVRDESRIAFRNIEKMDSWKDENGHGDYIATCELANAQPKQQVSRWERYPRTSKPVKNPEGES